MSEPDVLIAWQGQLIGIELGALAIQDNVAYDKQKANFLGALEKYLEGRIPGNVSIQLNFQFDKDHVIHRPTAAASKYHYLPLYLDGLFVYPDGRFARGHQVGLQESSRVPDHLFPNPRKPKEFEGFADELISMINGLQENDYTGDDHKHFFMETAEFAAWAPNPPDSRLAFSASIVDKFTNKYQGTYDQIYLIFHNHSLGHSNTHIYWHHLEAIVQAVGQLLSRYDTLNQYDGAFFMDFTRYVGKDWFQLYDYRKGEWTLYPGNREG